MSIASSRPVDHKEEAKRVMPRETMLKILEELKEGTKEIQHLPHFLRNIYFAVIQHDITYQLFKEEMLSVDDLHSLVCSSKNLRAEDLVEMTADQKADFAVFLKNDFLPLAKMACLFVDDLEFAYNEFPQAYLVAQTDTESLSLHDQLMKRSGMNLKWRLANVLKNKPLRLSSKIDSVAEIKKCCQLSGISFDRMAYPLIEDKLNSYFDEGLDGETFDEVINQGVLLGLNQELLFGKVLAACTYNMSCGEITEKFYDIEHIKRKLFSAMTLPKAADIKFELIVLENLFILITEDMNQADDITKEMLTPILQGCDEVRKIAAELKSDEDKVEHYKKAFVATSRIATDIIDDLTYPLISYKQEAVNGKRKRDYVGEVKLETTRIRTSKFGYFATATSTDARCKKAVELYCMQMLSLSEIVVKSSRAHRLA